MTLPIRLALAATLLASPALAQAPRVQLSGLPTATAMAQGVRPALCLDVTVANIAVANRHATFDIVALGAGQTPPAPGQIGTVLVDIEVPGYAPMRQTFPIEVAANGAIGGAMWLTTPPGTGTLRFTVRMSNDCNAANNRVSFAFTTP